MKRKSIQQAIATDALHFWKKQKNLRSKLPRRKRIQISPILICFSPSNASNKLNTHPNPKSTLSLTSNCDEVSCNTTIESVNLPPNAAFHTGNEIVSKPLKKEVVRASVSENSCVESCSVVQAEAESEVRKPSQNVTVFTESSAVLNSPSATVEQRAPTSSGYSDIVIGIIGSDLACTEDFSYDYSEDYSASELQSEIFAGNGDGCSEFEDFTDEYTPSMWLNSGSQFSEKSLDDSSPSICFSLFKEFLQQFSILSAHNSDYEVSSLLDDEYSDELAYSGFEDEEDEESYRRLRNRERSHAAKVKDYAEEYDFATDFGGLIAEQRLLMVNWIIELSRKKELQNESMFLGVRLLDRCLSKGYFTSRRNLQLLGIACLTLAIRIEENQPYNSVQQKAFYVGNNMYIRSEVVAMEWVVQEVLKFHCLTPTIYNFLWFYLKAAMANEVMERKAKYLASLALLDHRQLRFWPSTVAAGLVILVSLSANQDESCQRVVESHVRTRVDDLPECIKSLEWLVKYAW